MKALKPFLKERLLQNEHTEKVNFETDTNLLWTLHSLEKCLQNMNQPTEPP